MSLSRYLSATMLAIVVLGSVFLGLQGRAQASSSSVACTSMTVQLSNDKNDYIFTAHAAVGPGVVVTGYMFDFGDQQSYSVTFDPRVSPNRLQAAATHTYELNGDYAATASVLTLIHGQTTSVSSPACTTHVAVRPSASSLVNTGPGGLGLFIGATIAGTGLHYAARWGRHALGLVRAGL